MSDILVENRGLEQERDQLKERMRELEAVALQEINRLEEAYKLQGECIQKAREILTESHLGDRFLQVRLALDALEGK